jgi:hypothetical protein
VFSAPHLRLGHFLATAAIAAGLWSRAAWTASIRLFTLGFLATPPGPTEIMVSSDHAMARGTWKKTAYAV